MSHLPATVIIEPPPNPPPCKNTEGMKPIHNFLPQIPFYVGVIGPRHVGKTVWLYNLLSDKPGMYGSAFRKNNIIFFSPTKDKDPTLKPLKLANVYGPPINPQWLVATIQGKQKGYMEAENATQILLCFDDITQIKDAWAPLTELSYYGRHELTNVIYVAHKFSSIPRGVRTQTQQWIIFKPHEYSERQWILETFSDRHTFQVWRNALNRCWQKKFNFAYIDYERSEFEEIYKSGFNDPLFTPEEREMLESQHYDSQMEKSYAMGAMLKEQAFPSQYDKEIQRVKPEEEDGPEKIKRRKLEKDEQNHPENNPPEDESQSLMKKNKKRKREAH